MRTRKLAQAAGTALAFAAPSLLGAQPAIEEVRVVATPHDLAPTEVAQSVTVLAGDRLQRSLRRTLGETLAGELGVSSTYFGSGASRPVIRGLAGARVKIMEDGVEALDVSSVSADHAVGVDPVAARQIEVFRGPTTLLYGSGAVGGIVNTVTNRVPRTVPDDGIDATLELGADSAARERRGAFALDGGRGSIAWHADAARSRADDYEIPGTAERDAAGDPEAVAGIVPNSDYDTRSAAVGAAWLGERSMLGFAVRRFATEYGVPHPHAVHDADEHVGHGNAEHDHDDEHAAAAHGDAVRIDLDATRIDLRGEWLGLARFPGIELRVGIGEYEHLEIDGGTVATRFRSDAYEARVEVEHAPWGEWSGAFGAQLGARELEAVGDEAFIPPVDSRSAGVFVLEHRAFGPWRASLGGRVERMRHEPLGGPVYAKTASSVSAAVIRELPVDVSISVNAAWSERVPAAEELYSNGPHLASSAYEIGDPALGVETARHVDVGIRRAHGRITWALTAFRTDYDDFVYLAATGAEDTSTGLPIFAHVQRDATLAGFEAELFAKVAKVGAGEVDLRLYVDDVRVELGNGERAPRIPPRRHGIRWQYHDERVVAGIEAVRYGDQRRVAPFETPTDGYTLLGFDVSLKLRGETRRPLALVVTGTNLLNEDARKATSIVKDLAPLPGRNFAVGLRASL